MRTGHKILIFLSVIVDDNTCLHLEDTS